MFKYIIVQEGPGTERGPLVQILYGDNIIDECGPWESLGAAISWAESYVAMKNAGVQEPQIS